MWRTGRVAAFILVLLLALPAVAISYDRYHGEGGKEAAYRAGYDAGYRDGLRQGSFDLRWHYRYNLHEREYFRAQEPYWSGFAPFKGHYRKGYRDGYRDGYNRVYRRRADGFRDFRRHF